MGSDQSNSREAANRASFYDGEFSISDLKFRPFSIASLDHVETFGLGALMGMGDEPESDLHFLHLAMTLAWTLWADPETVTDLALDLEEAETPEERKLVERQVRKQVLKFKDRIPVNDLPAVVAKITKISERVMQADFGVQERGDLPEGGEDPPGNS